MYWCVSSTQRVFADRYSNVDFFVAVLEHYNWLNLLSLCPFLPYLLLPIQTLKVSSQTNFLSRAWWYPIFYFFEKNVQGSVPCSFSWPISWPPSCFKSSCKKYSRVQKTGEDNEKSTWRKASALFFLPKY